MPQEPGSGIDWLARRAAARGGGGRAPSRMLPGSGIDWLAGDRSASTGAELGFGDVEVGAKQIPFVGQFVEAKELLDVYGAAKALERGEASEEDQARLRRFLNQANAKKGLGWITGTILANLPAYALEFLAGGAVAGRVAEKGAATAAGAALRQAVGRAARELGEGAVAGAVRRGAGAVARAAGTSAVQTATMPGRVASAAVERALADHLRIAEDPEGQDRTRLALEGSLPSFVEALPAGLVDTYIENLSEHSGGAIEAVPGVKLLQLKFLEGWSKSTGNPVGQALDRLAKGVGWNGLLAEMGEERVGDVLRAAVLGDPWADVLPSGKQALAEGLAFSVPGLVGAAARGLGRERAESAGSAGKVAGGQAEKADSAGEVQADPAGSGDLEAPVTGVMPSPAAGNASPGDANASRPREPVDPAGAMKALLEENVRTKFLDPESAAAARLVEPRDDEQRAMVEASGERGITLALVDAAGKRLRLPAKFDDGVLVMDANAPPGIQRFSLLMHEWTHAFRSSSAGAAGGWDRLEEIVRGKTPELYEAARAHYEGLAASVRRGTLPEDLANEEGVANTIENMSGFLQFTYANPQAAVRLATESPSMFIRGVRALVDAAASLVGYRTQRVRDLEELVEHLEDSFLPTAPGRVAGKLDRRLALRVSLSVRELFDEMIGEGEAEGPGSPAAPAEPPQGASSAPGVLDLPPAEREIENTEAVEGKPGAQSAGVPSQEEPPPSTPGAPAPPAPEEGSAPTPVEQPPPPKADKGKLVPKRTEDGGVRWVAEPIKEEPRAEPAAEPDQLRGGSEAPDLPFRVASELVAGRRFRNINDARALAEEHGFKGTAKELDEAFEAGQVRAAREIVRKDRRGALGPLESFRRLVQVYLDGPKLQERTSTSKALQAYSTPVPIGYLASRLAGIKGTDEVYEPTAGNGALLLEANQTRTVANELDPARAAELRKQGFGRLAGRVFNEDATTRDYKRNEFDVVIANPPFGTVRDDQGNLRTFRLGDFTTTQIDHAIALRSLDAMKDDGRAVLIIGSQHGFGGDLAGKRKEGYRSVQSRAFFTRLYGEYNVVDHFTIDGKLYDRQGAAWPIDVLVIRGRGKSARRLPGVDVPVVLSSWEQLEGKLDERDQAEGEGAEPVGPEGGRPADRPGDVAGGPPGADADAVPEPAAGGDQPEGPGGAPAPRKPRPARGPRRPGGPPRVGEPGERPAGVPGGAPAAGGPGVGAPATGDRGADLAGEGAEREPRGGEAGGAGTLAPAGAAAAGSDLDAIFEAELEDAFAEPEAPPAKGGPPPKVSDLEQAAQDLDGLFAISAWQGSGKEFERHSDEYISTGEGSAAFGWGHYFATMRQVAEYYRTHVLRKNALPMDALREFFQPGRVLKSRQGAGYGKVLSFDETGPLWSVKIISTDADGNPKEGARPVRHSTSPDIEHVEEVTGRRLGRVYQVEIAADDETLLHWDKLLQNQSETVKAVIAKLQPWLKATLQKNPETGPFHNYTGGDFYRGAVEDAAELNDEDPKNPYYHEFEPAASASKRLLKEGIRGIKYWDERSRIRGDVEDKTHNYVIFTAGDVAITGRFAIAPDSIDPELFAKATKPFSVLADKLGAEAKDPATLIRAIVGYLKDTAGLSQEKIKRMQPYIVRFARERLAPPPEEKAPSRRRAAETAENRFQAPYQPASEAEAIGTLVPTNMQAAITRALDSLRERVGNIDQYVADKLGYSLAQVVGTEDKPGVFSAEQVDGIALAIDNLERGAGFVIGDQTGVGKGRFVAAMMRYAMRQGQTPIFVTKTPGLYADMYRDLFDIGERGFNAFVTNSGLRGENGIPLPQRPGGRQGETLESPAKALQDSMVSDMIESGKLPKGYDALFTTYSQMQFGGDGKRYRRHELLERMAPGAIVVLDESHEAGGTDAVRFDAGGRPIPTRADFVRSLLRKAGGAVYSSATYAKNPVVMTLYFKTDMSHAVDAPEQLVQAIKSGGVPLQQVVANMLTEAGQYVRRERSYDGINIPTTPVEVDVPTVNRSNKILRDIFLFDLAMRELREAIGEEAQEEGGAEATDTGISSAGAQTTSFASVMHNVVAQSLLALKAPAVVKLAIEAHKRGEKPIIALTNTMGAFLEQYAEDQDLADGEHLAGFDFNRIYKNYLERVRSVSIAPPGGKRGERERRPIKDEDFVRLGFAHLLEKAKEIEKEIKEADLSLMPASPIDYMRNELEKAGVRTDEITGRQLRVDYGANMRLGRRVASDAAKKRAMNAYNEGNLDALILNSAGSTGFSLHASKTYKDRKPRRMLVVQPSLNIDVFMQTLGRIHRAGQVEKPLYDLLAASIPAEKRPFAVLSGKLGKLNANTTASAEGAVSTPAVDFLNKYGDEVVGEILRDDRETMKLLDVDADDPEQVEGLAAKATGRMAILPVEKQEELFQRIEGAYKDLIRNLDALGLNELEARTLDLDARTISTTELRPRTRSGPFGAAATIEKVDVRRLAKPKDPDEIAREAAEQAKAHDPAKMQEVLSKGQLDLMAESASALGEANKTLAALQEAHAAALAQEDPKGVGRIASAIRKIQERIEKLQRDELTGASRAGALRQLIEQYKPGEAVAIATGKDESRQVFHGYILSLTRKGRAKSPLALSDYEVAVYTTESAAPLRIPLSQVGSGRYTLTPVPDPIVRRAFERARTSSREIRNIVTGNLLSAFAQAGFGRNGSIVFYTDSTGETKQGLMLRDTFDPDEALESRPVRLKVDQAVQFLEEGSGRVVWSDEPGFAVSRDGGQFVLKAFPRGGKPYYLNKGVTKKYGDYTQRRGEKEWTLILADADQVKDALRIYQRNLGTEYEARDQRDAARAIAGKALPQAEFVKGAAPAERAKALHERVKANIERFYKDEITQEEMGKLNRAIQEEADADPDVREELDRLMRQGLSQRFAIEPDREDVKAVKKLTKKAERKGEATKVGSAPSRIASTSASPSVRAFQRAARQRRADLGIPEVVSRDEQRAEAMRRLKADRAGVEARIVAKADAGEPLNAWERHAAAMIRNEYARRSLKLKGKAATEAHEQAIRFEWAYEMGIAENARALGAIQDALQPVREQVLQLISAPSRKLRKLLAEVERMKRQRGVNPHDLEDRLRALKRQIEREAKALERAKRWLEQAGFDPELITEDYWRDPPSAGRIVRIVSTAKASGWDWFTEWRLSSMLGGPATQMANITGNAVMVAYDQHLRRLAETLTNMVVRDPRGPTWGEVFAFYRSWVPGLVAAGKNFVLAWRTELPVLSIQLAEKGVDIGKYTPKIEAIRGPKIPGLIGRIMRAPSLRMLLAADEFFSTMVAHTEGVALAWRKAHAEGFRGEELEERVKAILLDPTDETHSQSFLAAKRATFQSDDSRLVNAILEVRRLMDERLGGAPVGTTLLPFVRTPVEIFKVGLSIPFHPLKALWTVPRALARGNRRKATEDTASALMSLGIMGGIFSLLWSSGGDGDDDDPLPTITGSGRHGYEQRDLQNRTVPPYSVRIGDAWYSYRRVEPAAVTIATVVDIANEYTTYARAGEEGAAISSLGRMFASIADQAADKTFLRTFGDLYQVVIERDSKGALPRFTRDTLLMPMVPNVWRQPVSRADELVRQNTLRSYEDKGVWTAMAASLPYYAAPLVENAPPPRYDLWGRAIERGDASESYLARVLSPWPKSQDVPHVHKLDLLILNYNERVEAGEIGPEAKPFYGKPPDYWYTAGGETRYWTDDEWARLQEESGKVAASRLERRQFNWQNPDERDIETIKEALSDARSRVRRRILADRRAEAAR